MKMRLMTDEEVAAEAKADQDWWDSLPEEELKRIEWHEKHPRCDTCGQFLKKRPPRPKGLFDDIMEPESGWIGHYVQDYWGEWEHI